MVRDEWLARARLEGEAGRHRWANAEGIMGASRFGQDARNYRLEAGSTPASNFPLVCPEGGQREIHNPSVVIGVLRFWSRDVAPFA